MDQKPPGERNKISDRQTAWVLFSFLTEKKIIKENLNSNNLHKSLPRSLKDLKKDTCPVGLTSLLPTKGREFHKKMHLKQKWSVS